ncbi:MAG: PAS domain S-box protein [Bacteroidetes bacterium]|nr:PAS domain S-box protein [Bacteroidota bacterium]
MKLSTLSTLRKMIGAVAIGHSVMIFAIMVVNILYVNESAVELALGAARAKFDKDMQYRNWMTGVGGVYVQTSDSVRINPYIEYHERDVTTPSGRMLTLLNPMYMIEQVFRTPSDTFGTVSRMVSLDTTRNVGRPDAWEQEALQDFAQGGMERYTVETMNGQEVLRFIKPVFGVPFVPGNSDARPLPSYRGALSYMIPLAEVEIHQERDFLFDIGILAVIWVLGLVGIYIFGRLLRQELYRRIQDQDRFRQVTELSTDIIYIVDRTGRIIRGNASFYRHIGADAELRASVRLADFVRHESESELLSRLEQLFREPSTFESRHRNAAGTEIPVEITAIPVTIDDERYLYCTGRDISERKQREEKVKRSEQLFRQIWEQTGEGLRLTDANGIITKVNDAYCRLVEKSREELEGKPLSVVYSPEKKEEIIRKHISHFAHHVIQQNNEKEIELWNGERRWVYVSNSYVLTEGHQLQLLGTFRDITEQKRIEERIHRSDEQLRLVTRNSQDLIFRYEVRPAARFLFVSPSAVTITGYTPEELYADPALMERIIDPEDRRRTSYAIVRAQEDRITVEVRVTTKQGAVIWTEQKITISRDAQRRVTAFEAIARDITERKRVEDELKSYNGLLTSMLENIPLDFWVRDKDGTMIIHSKAGRQFWGDLKGKLVESSVDDPAIIRRWQENNERALGGEIVRGERDYILPTNGERRTIFEVVAPFYIDGRTAGLLGINIDITEQRQLNDRLELQSAALNAAANAIVITDHAGIIEWVNPSFETLTGYRSAEAVGQDVNTLVRSGVHPDQFYATMWETVRAGKPWAGEMVNRRKNGTLYVEEQTLTPLMDPHGAIVHYIGIKQDVTEKKKVERQIVRDEQKFRSYMDAAPLGIFVKDRDGNYEEVNPAGLHMFGRTAAEMLGAHSSAFIDPAYRSAAKEFTSIVLHGGFASADLLFRRKDGTPFWVRENSVRLSDGKVISYKEDITSRREMERRLFDAHQQNTALFEQSSVGMAIAGLDRSIRRVNQRFAEMLGYTTEDLVGRTIDSITHPEDRELNRELAEQLYASPENSFTMEKRYIRKDGSQFWVRIDIVLIKDEEGKASYLAGIIQDINQEKNIAHAVRNLAINAGTDGSDTVFRNIVHNLAEALNADMSFIGLLNPDDRSVTTRSVYRSDGDMSPFTYLLEGTPYERVLEQGTVYVADNVAEMFPQDRALKTLGMRSYLGMSLVDSRGRSIGVLVVLSRSPIHVVQNYSDVLALFGERTVKELQAIAAEEALRRSEEEYRFLVDHAQDVLLRISIKGVITYCSRSIERLNGYTAEEVTGTSIKRYIADRGDIERSYYQVKASVIAHRPSRIELRLRKRSGDACWVEAISSAVDYPDGHREIHVVLRDITDKKRADQALLDQRNELAHIISNLPGFIYRISPGPDMHCLFISDAVEEITGYGREEYLADNISIHLGAIHPDDLVRCTEVVQYAVSNKQKYELEYRFRRKDGVQIWLWERGNPVLDSDGHIRYIDGYVSDISLSKTALEGLQQSEQRFRVVWDSTNEAMRLTDADGTIVLVNEAYCTLVRLPREELIGAPISVVYPQERSAHVMERYRENFENRDVLEFFEQDITLKNGSVIFVQASNAFLHLTGEETLLLSVFRDITARVHAERDVMLSEQRYRSLIETSLDGFWAVSMDGRILEVNDAYCRMSGYSREQMLTKSVSDLEVNERPEDVLERIRTIQEKGKLKFESHHRTRSGEVVLMEINTVYHREWDEILAFFNNITSKRAAEQALIDRELQYRTLISTMHQGMAFHEMLFDAAGVPVDYRFLDVNPSFESLTGLTASEIIGRTVLEVLPQTERYWIETYGTVVNTGVPCVYENYAEALGKYFEVIAYRPKPGHFATIISDITDRKLSEEKVIANERRYRLLAENSTDVIWTMTFEGQFTYISPSVYQLRGYTPEEVMQQSMEEVICPGSIPVVMEGLKLRIRQARNNEPVPHEYYEVEQPCRNGATVWTEVVTHIMRDEQGAPTGIIGVSRDITSRKRSEDLLRARLLLSEYATTHTVKELLRKILDEAERITESTIGFFHFVEDDQRTISLQTWSTNTLANMCQAEGDGKHYPIDKAGVWVECVHQRAPVVHNDFAHVANKKGMPAGHAPVLRELLIPIMRNEKVVGIMGVGNKAFNYDQRDVEIASQLATMSWDILERRRAELSLQHQEQALAGLSTAAVQLLHMNERNSDETIDSALKELGTGLNADRVYIFQNIVDRNNVQYTSMVHEWSRDGISRELQNPKMQYLRFDLELPTMWQALSEGNSLNAFTYELTEQERTILEEQQIQSIILVPITIEERFWGFLGVDAVRAARRWSPDEESVIRVAAESFGIAIQRITAVAQLFEREQMLKFALEASGDGVWNYTIPTRELYISREAKLLAGYQDDEFPNLFEAWIDKIHPEDRASVQIDMDRHLRGEAPFFLNEHRLLCKDGTYRWMLDRGKVLTWNKDGTPFQIFGTYSDIHHRKETEEKVKELNEQLEQKVTERTKQLRDSMQEMESFSYTISHDLRAPVRAIDSFTKILSDEEEARLSAEGKRLLNNVRANTSRMGRMIDDLLQFSRASRAEILKVPFDMGALMTKVAEEARAVEPQRSIRISVLPLPKAFGDPSLLRQVAVNLVGNAVKFTRHRAEAQIEIGGVETDGELTYWVKDNGTGFDMRYADKLFGVFQRLHGQQEFEGTGVGLAIVHRILQKHGGSITVQSQEGTGTTFTFTIPAQP